MEQPSASARTSHPGYAALREALQAAISSAREVWMFGPGSGSCILFHIADPALSIVGYDGTQFSAAQLPLPHDYAGPRDGPRHWRALDLLVPVPSLRTLLNAFPRPRPAENDLLQVEGMFYTVGDTGSVCSGRLTFHSPALMRELAVPLVDSLYIRYPSWDVLFSMLSESPSPTPAANTQRDGLERYLLDHPAARTRFWPTDTVGPCH